MRETTGMETDRVDETEQYSAVLSGAVHLLFVCAESVGCVLRTLERCLLAVSCSWGRGIVPSVIRCES